MIYTLTLNPCIDKTVTVDGFEIGATNRSLSYEKEVCGKGINTAVVIHNIGYDVISLGFEYESGGSVSSSLYQRGIKFDLVKVAGELRTNIKIYDRKSGITTELNEKGGEVSAEREAEVINKILTTVNKGDVFVMGGSVPLGVSNDIYYSLITELKALGVYTILDAEGELLSHGIKAKPDLIKPNRDELSDLLGRQIKSVGDAVSAAKELCISGVGAVCVSLGKEGAVLVSCEKTYHAFNKLDSSEIKGTVGAGDSMVAGLAIGLSNGSLNKDALIMGSALSAGSISLPSTQLCTHELYQKMLKRVCITEI